MKRILLKDIALKAGVSISMVSFVLNGKAEEMRINKEQAQRIKEIAAQLNYQPNILARGLRTGKTNLIGLIVEDISNPFFSRFAKVVEDSLKPHHYKIMYCSTENDPARAKMLINLLLDTHVDGFIIIPTLKIEKELQHLEALDKPVVLFDRFLPGSDISCVMMDNYKASMDLTKMLRKKKYKNIAFVRSDMDMIQMNERERGYREALKNEKGTTNNVHVLKLEYEKEQKQHIEEIINWLNKHPEIDAIIFATNLLAISGMEAFRFLNKKIKEDIAIVSFDDNVLFRLSTPAISVIEQPMELMGMKVVELLLESIKKGKMIKKKRVITKGKLIVRESQ